MPSKDSYFIVFAGHTLKAIHLPWTKHWTLDKWCPLDACPLCDLCRIGIVRLAFVPGIQLECSHIE